MTSPKAIFIDIDETLVSHGAGPFEDDLAQIEAARERGHRFFLNTGRSLGNIPRELQESPWVEGIIAGAGAHVIYGGQILYHSWVPEAILLAASEFYLKQEKWCVFEGEEALYEIHLPNLGLNGVIYPIKNKNDFLTTYAGARISKITIGGGITEAEKELLEGAFNLIIQRNYFEGLLPGINKARGMEMILEKIGIPRENSIAIGDSVNDIDMIRYAGLGIAMGNAKPELKEIAGAITGDCGKGGIAQAIVQYVLT
jgi:Cof subfamily protein (haloacid dehalogenase superfamily)